MHLERLQAADISRATDVAAAALKDDELHAVLSPRRHEYYGDYRAGHRRRVTARFYNPTYVLWVAVTDAGDEVEDEDDEGESAEGQPGGGKGGGGGRIVGYAAWSRTGKGEEARRWRDKGGWWMDAWYALQRAIVTAESYIVKKLGWDRSLDSAAEAHVAALLNSDRFPPSLFPEMWYLAVLVVDPAYQRRGIGKMLVEWAVQQAEAERVPIGLEASEFGRRLYERCGFQCTKKLDAGGGVMAPVMVWEPPGLSEEESWVERLKRDEEDKKTV